MLPAFAALAGGSSIYFQYGLQTIANGSLAIANEPLAIANAPLAIANAPLAIAYTGVF
ncbi:MAG: hypothetical protein LBP19_09135 [Treponema sp.]|nr:hypothetical protein [Treponema sp.]